MDMINETAIFNAAVPANMKAEAPPSRPLMACMAALLREFLARVAAGDKETLI